MTGIIIVRASSLSGYADCPRRAAARMLRREVEAFGFRLREPPRSIGAAVGTAVHAAAAVTLKEKAASGTMPPADDARDAAVQSLRETTAAEGVMFDRDTPAIDAAETQALRMADAWRDHIAPQIEPVAVEERLEAEVAPGLVLSGQSDVIAREAGRVRDLKTGARRGHHRPQLGAYSLLARTHGVDVRAAAEDFVARVAVAKPQPTPETHTHDVAGAEVAALAVLRRIDADIRTFRNGDPESGVMPGDPWAFLANPSSMLCSEKWCPAHGTEFCREHRIKENA
jgi:hypothetical protein